MNRDFGEPILKARQRSFLKAFENAARAGTYLILSRNEILVEVKPLIHALYQLDNCSMGLQAILDESKKKPGKHKQVFKESHRKFRLYIEELILWLKQLIPHLTVGGLKLQQEIESSIISLNDLFIHLDEIISDYNMARKDYAKYEAIELIVQKSIEGFRKILVEEYRNHTDINLLTLNPNLSKPDEIRKLFQETGNL